MPSVYIKTYGCQMNERDSEAVAAQLVAKGYTLAPSEAMADVILLNTCSVRDMAEQKALGKMAALAGELRRSRPNVVLGFMGCMAQSRGRELIDRLPDVDLVIGTQKFHRTAEHLDSILSGRADKVVDVDREQGSEAAIREHLLNGAGKKSVSAFVSIMQGCNQYCTFCIVPYTRGQERSRRIEDIVAECRELVSHGVREITLLGQIVTSYGRRDLPVKDGKSPFVQLLEAVHEIDGLERIRFTAPHPKGYGDDLVEAYGRLPKLCESAHIPVQSGSNRVLKLMHRGYTRERYLEIIRKLRAIRPDIGLSTDIIVGFPGETEDDFAKMMKLIDDVGYDASFSFIFSPRPGTPAANLADDTPHDVKLKRLQQLQAVIEDNVRAISASRVGTVQRLLVEGPSRKNPTELMGRTFCNRVVNFDGGPHAQRLVGHMVDVVITEALSHTLRARVAVDVMEGAVA